MGMEGLNKPEKLSGAWQNAIVEDPNSPNTFHLDEEAAQEALTADDVSQILEEMKDPNLDPKLRTLFQITLKNKGVDFEHIDLSSDKPLN
jgi:hypothetical protein